MIWAVERNRAQGELVAAMYLRSAGVPCERRSVMAAGLPGADVPAVLAEVGIDRARYLTISLGGIKEEMAARHLIPRVAGLSPMEASELVHAESAWLAKRLGLRAVADGRNILWEMSIASVTVSESWLVALETASYTVRGVFVDISVEDSVRRSEAIYRSKHEDYRNGIGYGGRYVPPEAIRALAISRPGPADRGTVGRPARRCSGQDNSQSSEHAGREAAGPGIGLAAPPGDEVTGPILGYVAGELTLEEVVSWFRARRWPDVPGACPPGLERAASAIDDPEPYVPGSFDDVVRAYDLGQLTDLDYDFLGGAVMASHQAHGST